MPAAHKMREEGGRRLRPEMISQTVERQIKFYISTANPLMNKGNTWLREQDSNLRPFD
jgi:hypothetical protein